jgi:hypothetical protein
MYASGWKVYHSLNIYSSHWAHQLASSGTLGKHTRALYLRQPYDFCEVHVVIFFDLHTSYVTYDQIVHFAKEIPYMHQIYPYK